jgi:hypothetical protein
MTLVVVSVTRGTDMPDDRMRTVHQYWSLDGRCLAEHDPINFPD